MKSGNIAVFMNFVQTSFNEIRQIAIFIYFRSNFVQRKLSNQIIHFK